MKATGKILTAFALFCIAALACLPARQTYADHAVNINTAEQAELTTLAGIGDVKAQAIIDYREANGPFASIEDVQNVSGIGPATYANIKDHITVEGAAAQQEEEEKEGQATTTAQTQTTTHSGSSKSTTPLEKVRINDLETVIVNVPTQFVAEALNADGEPLYFGMRYTWNFGDGAVANEREAWHTYTYPGTYTVTVTAEYKDVTATSRMVLTVRASSIALVAAGDGSLSIVNNTGAEINIGRWALAEGKAVFRIPQDTLILAGETLRFAPAITGLAGSAQAQLLFPNGAFAAAANTPQPLTATKQAGTQVVHAATVPAAAPELQMAAVADTQTKSTTTWLSLLGLGAVIAAGAGGTYYARSRPVAKNSAEEFDIED